MMDSSSNNNDASSEEVKPTEMIYYTHDGNFQMECEAKVISYERLEEEGNVVVRVCLDRTVLHAQGGGQPTDKGIIYNVDTDATIEITKVLIDRTTGIAMHTGTIRKTNEEEKSKEEEDEVLMKPGDVVRVKVNEDNRQILSECHTAGHVVDAAMVRTGITLQPIKGFHFLDGPYVEYKGAIPAEERSEKLKSLQSCFRDMVNENSLTKIEILPKDKAIEVCARVAQNFAASDKEETIRVVTVAGEPLACGGTHVKSTMDLKERKWGIIGFKCKKGVMRVKYGQNQE